MRHRTAPLLAFADYLTIGDAAALLGVCIETLRNWDRQGKLKPIRHPLNGYRLYRRDDLEALLERTAAGRSAASRDEREAAR